MADLRVGVLRSEGLDPRPRSLVASHSPTPLTYDWPIAQCLDLLQRSPLAVLRTEAEYDAFLLFEEADGLLGGP